MYLLTIVSALIGALLDSVRVNMVDQMVTLVVVDIFADNCTRSHWRATV